MVNPFMFLAPLNGTLAFQDRAGGGTLTASGAIRYAAASGARTNYVPNPTFGTNTTGWIAEGASSFSRITNDGGVGTTCLEVTCSAAANDGPGTTTAAGNFRVGGPGTYKISFYAKVVSGATDFYDRTLEFRADGLTNIGSNNSSTDFTFTSSWARYSRTITTIRTGTHYLTYGIFRKTAAASVVRLSNFQLEAGSTLTDYFDGSTGGAWLDPITGILGTAHASPSVSQAVAWVEEGTTNGLSNPSFETNTTGWLGLNATITRVSTYARNGSYSCQTVMNNASALEGMYSSTTDTVASSGQAWTLSVYMRGSGTGKLYISEATAAGAFVAEGSSSVFTLTDAWQRIEFTRTLAGGGTVARVYAQIRVDVQQAATWYIDAVQLEQKAYATSYCDGAIGTGYAWSGTAHASSSTRTATTIKVDETARIRSDQGAIVGRVYRNYDIGATTQMWQVGGTGANNDQITARVPTGGAFAGQFYTNNGAGNVFPTPSGTVTLLTWKYLYQQWNGVDCGQSIDNGTIATATRGAPGSNGLANANDISLGSANTSGGQLNGLINNVAIFDRPLTAKERATIYARVSLVWGMLRSGFRHGRIV